LIAVDEQFAGSATVVSTTAPTPQVIVVLVLPSVCDDGAQSAVSKSMVVELAAGHVPLQEVKVWHSSAVVEVSVLLEQADGIVVQSDTTIVAPQETLGFELVLALQALVGDTVSTVTVSQVVTV
jgi:hypothetical protein